MLNIFSNLMIIYYFGL